MTASPVKTMISFSLLLRPLATTSSLEIDVAIQRFF
jgi:hypothetical protein